MNLIDENFEPKRVDNSKKVARIILILIAIILIAIITIFGVIVYMQSKTLRLYINGSSNEKVKDMMVIDNDGTIYFPVKDVASYLGYQSYNGCAAGKGSRGGRRAAIRKIPEFALRDFSCS